MVGERGHQPSATVWNLATGVVVRELAGGHRFGIGCVAFTPSGGGVVTMGFKHDRMLRVRNQGCCFIVCASLEEAVRRSYIA